MFEGKSASNARHVDYLESTNQAVVSHGYGLMPGKEANKNEGRYIKNASIQ